MANSTSSEYNKLSSYSSLYETPNCCSGIRPPVPSCTPVVPVYSSPGYQALTHNLPYPTGDYFNVLDAYPSNCTVYKRRFDCAEPPPACQKPEETPRCNQCNSCSGGSFY